MAKLNYSGTTGRFTIESIDKITLKSLIEAIKSLDYPELVKLANSLEDDLYLMNIDKPEKVDEIDPYKPY